ncbi:hypothetical protein [Streptomyces nanshensis]|uniref:Uncharacterized protein n=1 Tax=Streptomyces nanshensis TaxID=518642 RepID=A0A1E7LC62_9ACTN|nr:hypothetical protein [Streptomyces nanshensis]OEV13795.1 hypothetical protein AN218_01810 [Streptomyces nanshensis]
MTRDEATRAAVQAHYRLYKTTLSLATMTRMPTRAETGSISEVAEEATEKKRAAGLHDMPASEFDALVRELYPDYPVGNDT